MLLMLRLFHACFCVSFQYQPSTQSSLSWKKINIGNQTFVFNSHFSVFEKEKKLISKTKNEMSLHTP